MSDQNQVIEVQASSLPRTMQYTDKVIALECASYIAQFLKGVVEDRAEVKDGQSPAYYQGMALVFDMLIDKIDYACGDLKLPCATLDNNAPTWTELLEAGQAALKEREGARHD